MTATDRKVLELSLDRRLTSQQSPYNISDICHIAVSETIRGRLAISIAPGKKDTKWNRDLELDLKAMKDNGIQVIVCLLEIPEMKMLGIENYLSDATQEGFIIYHLPIRDRCSPTQKNLDDLMPRLVYHLSLGHNILIHCRGGLGRAGTICACCLGHFGCTSEQSIGLVRKQRPGAIQTRKQEQCIVKYCSRLIQQ